MEENQSTSESSSKGSKKGLIIAVIAVVIILVIAGGGFAFLNLNKETANEEAQESAAVENSENQAQVSPNPTESMVSSEQSGSEYKDGTYKAIGSYSYHSGKEEIDVTIVLKNGAVEDVVVVNMAKAPTSKKIQDDFIANFKTEVVGKNIDEVKLGKISGSSLTPIGFNAAVEDIKSQAKG